MKILLADDHELFSEGFSLLLGKIFQQSHITQVRNWPAAKALASNTRFDLAILDLFMPAQNSWTHELNELINCNNIHTVCILTSSAHQSNVQQAFALGVKGYIHKSSTLAEIHKALDLVMDDKVYLPSNLQSDHDKSSGKYGSELLTARQHKILTMLAEGKENRRIAIELNIKESTVKRHVYNIFQQLKAGNRTEAVHLGRQHGLLQDE
ncbi:MAG: response regulator transcription factor [Thiolinea sp.]